MTNEEINAKVQLLHSMQAHKKDLETAIDAIKDALKAELDASKSSKLTTDKYNIFWDVYEKSSVDTSALKSAGLYEQFSKKTVNTIFKVTNAES